MALSYNLGYQESISVHPTSRQLVFPNIWEWLISWFSGIILNTHMRIHATVAGQIFHHGRFEGNIFKSIQISWFEITRTLVGPYFNSQPLQCRHLLKHVRFSFHWRVKVCVWDRNGIDFIFKAQSEPPMYKRRSSDSQNMDSITWHFLYKWWKLCDHS